MKNKIQKAIDVLMSLDMQLSGADCEEVSPEQIREAIRELEEVIDHGP